jgi:hypothetical protein
MQCQYCMKVKIEISYSKDAMRKRGVVMPSDETPCVSSALPTANTVAHIANDPHVGGAKAGCIRDATSGGNFGPEQLRTRVSLTHRVAKARGSHL